MNRSRILMTGIAIFSMFFGAGNVVFPLLLGVESGDRLFYALAGLLATSIGGPLIGLAAATLFQGNAKNFFYRTGPIFGFVLIILTLGLLGPFAVLPRCVVVSHAAATAFFPDFSLSLFSLMFCMLAFVASVKQTKVLPLLGYVLSPLLLVSLLCIILSGVYFGGELKSVDLTSWEAFKNGAFSGYDTMDLIAAIFFSTAIWHLLDKSFKEEGKAVSPKILLKTLLFSGLIGGMLLALMYAGLSLACAFNHNVLHEVPPQKLMTAISYSLLGPFFGSIANLAVLLACFTTVISLAVTISDVLRHHFLPKVFSHSFSLALILGVTALLSTIGFEAIMSIIHPLVALCYPAIIVLALCNIAHLLWGFPYVKTPVYLTLAMTLVSSS